MESAMNSPLVSTEWRYALLGELEAPSASRVFSSDDLVNLVRHVRPRATERTIRLAVSGLVQAGALTKVSQSIYLNRRCRPTAELAEAAQRIRRGAVVSLESVLGECGFLNNTPAIVTAIVPKTSDYVPNVGPVKTSGGQVFRFSALPPQFFPWTKSESRLMLQAGRHCPMAKPEVAVLHWLRLAQSPRSPLRIPPQDVDFSVLDMDLLKELAWRWELSMAFESWMRAVEKLGDVQEPTERGPLASSEKQASLQRGQAAKTRLLARRNPTTA